MLQNDDKEKSGGNSGGTDLGSNDSPPPTRDGGDYVVKTEQ